MNKWECWIQSKGTKSSMDPVFIYWFKTSQILDQLFILPSFNNMNIQQMIR